MDRHGQEGRGGGRHLLSLDVTGVLRCPVHQLCHVSLPHLHSLLPNYISLYPIDLVAFCEPAA